MHLFLVTIIYQFLTIYQGVLYSKQITKQLDMSGKCLWLNFCDIKHATKNEQQKSIVVKCVGGGVQG